MNWRLVVLLVTGLGVGGVAAGDTTVRVPPLYDTFVPPPIGGSYTDPVFGVAITRLSDAPNTANAAAAGQLSFISTEYPTASPFNVDNTRLILLHQSYFGLYDENGVYLDDLPLAVHSAAEPRWSRSDPDVLYYVSGNSLMRLDVPTRTSSLVRSFGEYAAIRGRGESDISRDGDHFVFSADELAGPPGEGIANRYVFVYEISTDTKGPVLDTAGHAFDQLYIAPDNGVIIGWLERGAGRFTGVELFDRNMVFRRQLTHAIGHMHLTRDVSGDDLLVWVNSNDPQPLENCQNGLVKVRLADARQTCLLELDWRLAVHITAPDGNGWVFAGTYDPLDPPPTLPDWRLHSNEILQVKLDGTETRRLLHHRSRQTANYGYQPRASVSRDGSRLVYTSNYNLEAIQGQAAGYTDAYLVAIPALVPPRVSIDDASVVEGQTDSEIRFTVSLSHASDLPVAVSYATVDQSAVAPSDYQSTTGTLHFAPGETTRTIAVPVSGDAAGEPNETFFLNLATASNAVIVAGQGLGTIVDDDLAPVQWTRVVAAEASGNSLSKSGGGALLWNSGAVSVQALVSGDGQLEFVASETNTHRMAGLGNGDSDPGYATIAHAVYLASDQTFSVYESGVPKTGMAPYSSRDRFAVGVESGVVKYRRNGTVFYVSGTAPSYPLLVEASLYTPGATVTNARVLGFSAPTAAVLTSPTPGSTLTGSSVTLTWSAGFGVSEYWLYVGTTPGGYELYEGSQGTSLTRTLTNLPVDGRPLYVRLWSRLATGLTFRDYTYAAATPAAAVLTAPTPGSTLTGSNVTLTWSVGSGVSEYWLYVGTTPGGYELYEGSQGTNLTRTVTNLPVDGQRLYVRLWSRLATGLTFRDYSYTAATPAAAVLTAPTPGSTLTGSSVTLTWSAGSGVSEYWLYVGTTPGGYELYEGSQGTNLTRTVTNLPVDGRTLYVRLWSRLATGLTFLDYTYTAATPAAAVLTAPTPGSTLTGSSVTLTWSAGSSVSEYWLYVGTTPGGYELYEGSQGTNLRRTVTNLPVDGRTLYVRLWSRLPTGLTFRDYTYTAYTPG